MDWLAAPDAWLGRLLFQRALAGIYLSAFLGAALQFRALVGEQGLTPIPSFLARSDARRVPSLLRWRYSDRRYAMVAWSGVVLSVLALVGVVDAGAWWASALGWFALWALYLSIVNVGQTWWGFGWESLLCEAGFLAVLLGPSHTAPPVLVLWALRWLVLRVEVGAGLIKWRGDPCWRDLTCLRYHHETQPLPGPLSWWFHRLPDPLHKVEVAANHVSQLLTPWLLLLPQPFATVGALVVVLTQGWLLLSGNFSWLNALTVALALPALSGAFLAWLLPISAPADLAVPSAPHGALVVAVAVLVVVLSWQPTRNLFSRQQKMNASFNGFHLVNTYGAFGSITRDRDELIIEGTADPTDPDGWREYGCKAKPGDVMRRPPQVAPYHLRLDWLLWFVAISPRYGDPWLGRLVAKLLAADATTLRLFRRDPFGGDRPAAIRIRRFRYRYSTRSERRETGAWWVRSATGTVVAPVHLVDGHVQPVDGPTPSPVRGWR